MFRIGVCRLIARGRQPKKHFFDHNTKFRRRATWPRAPHHHHGLAKQGTAAALRATTVGTILLAAARPLDASIPKEKQSELDNAWGELKVSGDLEEARRLCWKDCIIWLRHYLHGTFVDEGPLERDMVIEAGLYLRRADTRVFWVPVPEGKAADMPVACVAINSLFRAKVKSSAAWDEQDDHSRALAEEQENAIERQLGPRLDWWRAGGRFDTRCFVVVKYLDVVSFSVFEDGEFRPWNADEVTSEHWARDAFAICNVE
ncbi:hypothetical protein DL766_008044 [Monosporascus sp. MC13-8B]|uniref:Uncharacterized protein n=1 Tax=Monosporascus cannonballus TaxID=155416 RepID=A0ABY0GZV5_9PEZI|nr:hypothetical protein DL762_007497 [Monosporascus cannonballus]RYO82740.1 hypothetical protein DL763_008129 [Monosporascus cannonballus]RYP20991.1 hypothetical protein DL766_008044 [Monosporascus sp. MC13-8B]